MQGSDFVQQICQRRSDAICSQITRLITSETVLLSNEPVTEGSIDFSKVKQSDTL